jgi:hypothetical protein
MQQGKEAGTRQGQGGGGQAECPGGVTITSHRPCLPSMLAGFPGCLALFHPLPAVPTATCCPHPTWRSTHPPGHNGGWVSPPAPPTA